MNWPWSIISGLAYLYVVVLICVLSDNRPALRKLWGGPVCIICISLLLLGCLMLGLGIISNPANPVITIPAFVMMTAAGLSCADEIQQLLRKLFSGKEKDTIPQASKLFPDCRLLGRMLSHLGLFMWIAAALFGIADTEKVNVLCRLDQETVTGQTTDGQEVMLPFGITLHKFEMQEYPGKVYVTDRLGNPVEDSGWDLTVIRRMDNAWPADADTIVELKHLGAVQAAFVRAMREYNGKQQTAEGWVYHESSMLDARVLELGDSLYAVMARPAAKDYLLEITVSNLERKDNFNLRVNHPARTGKWKIFQAGYDISKGRWSMTSSLLCVRDPWRKIKMTALWILLAGGLIMALGGAGARRRTEDDDSAACAKTKNTKTAWGATGLAAAALLAFTYLIIFKHNLHKDLPPALQSWWYVPHVASYITAYSLLAAATVLALWRCFRHAENIALDRSIERLVRAGWGLLTLGLTMGALWASEAWGDFWTWDPKETWAAATWLCYLVYMHLPRLFARISGQYGDRTYRNLRTAVLVLSFLLLQMSWWGVKLLAGSGSLHVYS